LGGPKIQVAQLTYGSTAGFRGMTDIPSFIVPQYYCEYYSKLIMSTIIIIDYLAVGSGSAPGEWAVVPGIYRTHLKHGQCSGWT